MTTAIARSISIRTPIPGPRSRVLVARREAAVPNGRYKAHQIAVESASGALVTDVDGNTFIDFIGGIGVLNAGHCPPEVVAAIQAQAAKLLHFSGVGRHLRAVRRAGRAPQRRRADRRAVQNDFVEQRRRGRRERDQDRARCHRSPGDCRIRGRLPRPHADDAFAHQQDSVQKDLTHVRARDLPRAVPVRLSHGPERRGGGRAVLGGVRAHAGGRRRPAGDRSSDHRAGAGRGRFYPGTARVYAPAARILHPQRQPADRRRGAVRLWAHRHAIRHGANRRRARYPGQRQVDRRRPAAGRHHRPRRDHG